MSYRMAFQKLLPLLPLLFTGALAELAVRLGWVAEYLVPAPSQVLRQLNPLEPRSDAIWGAALETGRNASIGFFASLVSGLVIAIALSSSRRVERVFYPYAVFFQTVPIIAIAPLLVIWFGYGTPTVIASTWIVSVFPVIAGSLNGLRSTEPALVDLFRIYGASGSDRLFKLRLPSALPSILTGARIAGGLAVIGAIVGEFVAGGGLGGIVDEARTQQRVDRVFAAVLLSSLLGFLFFSAVGITSRRLLRAWHASEKGERR